MDETTFTYTVTAPDAAGSYTFSGVIEDSSRRSEAVGGDSDITVWEGFADVNPSSAHAANIEALYALGITRGCSSPPLRFCPDREVTRAEMATFLVRALELEAPSEGAGFADVDASGVHAANIEALAAAGITTGCEVEPLRFCPDREVSRAEMATFLVRALELEAPSEGAGFADVDASGVHAANIEALAAAGITTGCHVEPLRFCPGREVTRAQMATFLVRALNRQGPAEP